MVGLSNIRRVLNNNGVLISNFSYLSLLQVVNLLIPLVTYPYLIRVLGSELYGLVVFTQVISGYFTVFISFGFSTIGTKDVSLYRLDTRKTSEIVSNITAIKMLFLFVSFVVLLSYLVLMDVNHKWLYVFSFWVCILDVVFPVWFFQGIEKMKYVTLTSLFTRGIFVCMIFFLIKTREDVLWLPISNLIGSLLSGLISYHFMKKEGISFVRPSYSTCRYYLRESYHLFLSNVLIQFYANSNRTIVGIFLGMRMLAYYDLADKIVGLIRIPHSILSQTVFPRISSQRNIDFIKKIFKISLLFNIVLYFLLFFSAEYVVLLLGGKEMLYTVTIIKILGLLAPIVGMNNVLSFLTLIPFGHKILFFRLVSISLVVYLVFLGGIWSLDMISLYTLSIVTVLVEVFVTIVAFYYVYKNVIWKENMII
ncbi:Polysaccharide biosynthesis family protein [Capnocytophaga canis]|uniref:Polysaccharide biosynthesis family protein n=1 Tax=Capnocytophaga canis TaxID=1848903 RepID=A0A0B7I2P3_9FLAO|nr:oligosaccharide flippase family protein [Capnocytophaga canis]CEN43416.1 Polysaccharide biosynthesis family protein [Capnocytophaga canis]CEN44362.1 Polysaccharide biosynthesis family protein [Capnocytophaga canis]